MSSVIHLFLSLRQIEVLDNDLPAHLGVLGIDVLSQVKTEKSIAEQELEINLNLTSQKLFSFK